MKNTAKRIMSLDMLRGLTIMGMILVNTQGIGPERFEFLIHCAWDGCRFADMVYPFFIFIVGASVYYAFRKVHTIDWSITWKILKRTFLIALVGIALHSFPYTAPLSQWRIPGVLQRIALVYMCVSFLVLYVKDVWKLIAVVIGILLGYWGILLIGSTNPYDNIVRTVDIAVFGENHLYTTYLNPPTVFDPEGLLGSLPAVANALLGYLTSHGLDSLRKANREPWPLGIMALGLIGVSCVWNLILPFNKPLWTPSFALLTSAWAMLLWIMLYYLVDRWEQRWLASPFLVFGTNALLAYVISEFLLMLNYQLPFTVGDQQMYLHQWLDTHCFSVIAQGPMRPALWGLLMLLVCWLLLLPLYRRRIFVKL